MGGYGQTSQESSSYTPAQEKWMSQALDVYGPQLGQNPNVYQGQRVADFSPLQEGVFDFADSGGFITTPEQTQSYFKGTIADPATKQFQEVVNPTIKEAYSGPGYWGSARANAQVDASKDLADSLNTEWARLNWDVNQANKQGALTQYDLGTQQQVQRQQQLDTAMQKFAEENQITDPRNLEILMSLLGMNYSSGSSDGFNISFS
jgi:hypothetical protein